MYLKQGTGDDNAAPGAVVAVQKTSDALRITMDTLRNWEMNGLLNVKRKENGYRVYSNEDIQKLKIIRFFGVQITLFLQFCV